LISQTFEEIFNIKKENHFTILATLLDADDELVMRDYLANPNKRFELAKGRVWVLGNIDSIW